MTLSANLYLCVAIERVLALIACIVLNPKDIRVPKIVPLLELFSSKGGTFEFQGRNFLVPAEELFGSCGSLKMVDFFFVKTDVS